MGIANILFVFSGFIDAYRRMIIMQTIGSQMSVNKAGFSEFTRALPTIDVGDPQSLHSWLEIRQCLLDFGKRY